MIHTIVDHSENNWYAVPANNGENGCAWQWGDEILIGYTCGKGKFDTNGHQVDEKHPYVSKLARSRDGGESWETWVPSSYAGYSGRNTYNAASLMKGIDFSAEGFVMRIEGSGYHGNTGRHWFYSMDKGNTWKGPYSFGNLFEHPELINKRFTGRTAYLVNGPADCFLFLSVRDSAYDSLTDKVFLARTSDGGVSFQFISWIVPPSDPYRAVMPSPVRISDSILVAAIRRRDNDICWLDCYHSVNNGESWTYLSRIGNTGNGPTNGNPPAMIRMHDSTLCCVFGDRDRRIMMARYSKDGGRTWGSDQILRADFKSVNGWPDLGYPRIFQRRDGLLVVSYFWCTPERPETHIEATIFRPEI